MKEDEIRNRDTFNEYLDLAAKDSRAFFADSSSFVYFKCPACGDGALNTEFKKNNFQYVSCKTCSTLFVNPRPLFERLKDFYSKSPSAVFWVEKFFKPVAEARREKIFKPRAEYISKNFQDKSKGLVGDVGAGFGIFLEELRKLWPKAALVAIEPSPEQCGICRSKGLEAECCALEEMKGFENRFDLLTAFELMEHLFDPGIFLKHVRQLLKDGGYFLFTTLNGQGFDIQLLWKRSKSVSPPHHLNFFNPRSIALLLERSGFEVVEISTPGKLDWDIVEGMIKNEQTDLGRFWGLLAEKGRETSKDELQNWISRNNYSSHMRVLARKPIS